MTTTLRVIVDQIVAPEPGPLGRYTEDLTRALIATAPPRCEVEGVVSSSPESDYERLLTRLPGLARLYKTSLARRELAAAWQIGVTTSPSGGGIIHAPGLFAPLRRHKEDGMQLVVTVHELLAMRHPEALPRASASWDRAMLRRARRYADAIVVPTHALAAELESLGGFGDRVRVVATAPRGGLAVPADSAERARRLALPRDYLVTSWGPEPWAGVSDLLAAVARSGTPDLPVVLVADAPLSDETRAELAGRHGLDLDRVGPERLRVLLAPEAADLAVVLAGAVAYVAPAREAGDASALIEAFAIGTPVVHSDAPAHTEVAADAGIEVPVGDGDDGYLTRLAEAISAVIDDDARAERLAIAGGDRSHAFSWAASATQVWQLHADL